jgi:hypothetical protein
VTKNDEKMQAANTLAKRVKELGALAPPNVRKAAARLVNAGRSGQAASEVPSAVASVLVSLGNAEVGRHSWYWLPLDLAARHAAAVFSWRKPESLPYHEPDMAPAPFRMSP